ncbi:MAG: thiamine phosphate synthase [Candidatus Eremiobacteraeota bacterium]|nr:thiamine phosphate synthase [Candidatus Eremiobacteraeota bacterium]
MATDAHVTPSRVRRAALLHGIYAIVNESAGALELARACVDAGIRIVQYRAKRGFVTATLQSLRTLTRDWGALLIVNDDAEAAVEFDCDGVHLGPGDDGFADVARVRARVAQRLIGLSCGTEAEARAAGDADYLGVGSVYCSASKDDAGEPIGIAGLLRVARASALPVAAIGGIDAFTIADVRRSGVAMAAVISAVSAARDPRAAAEALVRVWRA